MKELEVRNGAGRHRENREHGFSMVELCVVVTIDFGDIGDRDYFAEARSARRELRTAMRQVISQLRQAREYAITNRRYVQITFSGGLGPARDRHDSTK